MYFQYSIPMVLADRFNLSIAFTISYFSTLFNFDWVWIFNLFLKQFWDCYPKKIVPKSYIVVAIRHYISPRMILPYNTFLTALASFSVLAFHNFFAHSSSFLLNHKPSCSQIAMAWLKSKCGNVFFTCIIITNNSLWNSLKRQS